MFEYMYRGRFGRLYDVHGHKQPQAWEAYREIVRAEVAWHACMYAHMTLIYEFNPIDAVPELPVT